MKQLLVFAIAVLLSVPLLPERGCSESPLGSWGAGRQWAPGVRSKTGRKLAGPPGNLFMSMAPSLGRFGGTEKTATSSYDWAAESRLGVSLEMAVRVFSAPAGDKGAVAVEIPFLLMGHSDELPPNGVSLHGLVLPTVRYDFKASPSMTVAPGFGIGGGAGYIIGDNYVTEKRLNRVIAWRLGVRAMFAPTLGVSLDMVRAMWKESERITGYWNYNTNNWETGLQKNSVKWTMLSLSVVFRP